MAIANHESGEYARWMGGVRGDIKVEVEGLLEEGGREGVAVFDGNRHVEEIYLCALGAESPFQPVVIINIIFELFPLRFI